MYTAQLSLRFAANRHEEPSDVTHLGHVIPQLPQVYKESRIQFITVELHSFDPTVSTG